MKIGLIDVDGHSGFPNIALMKLSAYHKSKSDDVSWYDPLFGGHYDKVYMSKVFSFTPDYEYCINADEIVKGGTGYCIELVDGKEVYHKEIDSVLPNEIEHQFPDYELYGVSDAAYGFLTRGCPRGCGFCHVGAKEGKCSHEVADLKEFWNGQKEIVLCDPNFFAFRGWGGKAEGLIKSGAYIDFNQGIDIRLMDETKTEALKSMRIKRVHFAWDRVQDNELIIPKMEQFVKRVGFDRRRLVCYILTNFDSTFEQDLFRVMRCREIGIDPYIMIYDKEHCTDKRIKKMQRWVNNRILWGAVNTFEEYLKGGE